MVNSDLTLFIEISNSKFSFSVGKKDDHGIFKFDSLDIQISGIKDNRIDDLEKVYNTLKENIYSLEKKNNFTFREIILILDNFDPLFLNISGFKKLNGSQVLKENITYILNSLKSFVNEVEPKKTILHIFNSQFLLDNKKVYNLPIGLFGDFNVSVPLHISPRSPKTWAICGQSRPLKILLKIVAPRGRPKP